MAAYLIVDVDIHDPENYERYKVLAKPIAEKFGGKYLARGGDLVTVRDELWSPTRIVVIEFPDMAAAQAFIDSEEYQPVMELRHAASRSTLVIVDGM